MVESHCCFIKEDFFKSHPEYKNMLDTGNTNKQSRRTHICVELSVDGNMVYVPLRNRLGNPNRKFGKIGFSVPSQKRRDAGLDYRYCLIINDSKYVEKHTSKKIPQSQYKCISKNYEIIKKEITEYIKKYIKAARKNRVDREPLFRVSSLVNFNDELKVFENPSQK